jgi:hypothetical protein
MTSNADRRRLMRVQLDTPITAKVAASRVVLIDISPEGARIEHSFPLFRGKKVILSFEAGSNRVSVTCVVVRCKIEKHDDKVAYFSGLHFESVEHGSLESLRSMITTAVQRDFEARQQHVTVQVH